jgi:molybdate transport system regulatory protein
MAAEAILKLKIQLYCGEEIAMGPGKADLLEAIRRHGSISAAGRAMGMSYRRAWLLVDAMNRCWRQPLVETSPGSAHGGGARVSAFGESVLAQYRALQARVDAAADCPDFATLQAAILPEPRRSQRD